MVSSGHAGRRLRIVLIASLALFLLCIPGSFSETAGRRLEADRRLGVNQGLQATRVDGTPPVIALASRLDVSRTATDPTIMPTPRTIAIASADFDGDDVADLVVANGRPNADSVYTVTLFFGDDTGSFGRPIDLKVGTEPRSLAVVDLNGDGLPDIITANGPPDNTLTVWLSNGDGTFTGSGDNLPLESTIGVGVSAMLISDFNQDGIPDVVTTVPGSGTIRVQLGSGDGWFGPPEEFDARVDPRFTPIAIVACDFDHDGYNDVVVLNTSGTGGNLSLISGDGSGSFSSSLIVIPISGRLQTLIAADLNNDGFIDLAVGGSQDDGQGEEGRVKIFHGISQAPYFSPVLPAIATPLSPVAMAVSDWDGDDRLELILALDRSQSVALYHINDKDSYDQIALVPSGGTPHSLVLGQFNGDQYLDVAVANTPLPSTDRSTISIIVGTPSHGLFLPPSPDVEEGFRGPTERSRPRALVTDDFDYDGILDLAVANSERGTVSILVGDGLGNFKARQSLPILCPAPPCDPGPQALVTGDFNNDGLPDLVVLNRYGNFVNFFAGAPNGAFIAEKQVITPFSDKSFLRPSALAAGDFNGDAYLDLVLVSENSTDLVVLQGQGDGAFEVHRYDSLGFGSGASAILAQDLDGDGILDLAVLFAPFGNEGRVRILKGLGDGTFCSAGKSDGILCCPGAGADCQDINPIVLQDQYGSSDLAYAYFSGVDRWYMAVVHAASRSLSILLSTPDGYALVQNSPLPGEPSAVLAVDLGGGSGEPAFVVVNETANGLSIFTRTEDRFIPQWMDYGVGKGPLAIVAGDFNQDGQADLATANAGDDTVTIILNYTKP